MADLAAQIRERLDGWAPPEPWVTQFADGPENPTPEEVVNFAEELSRAIEEGKFAGPIVVLPPSPKFYPGFEQMRDALLALLDEAYPDNAWIAHCIAKALGIEVDHG